MLKNSNKTTFNARIS